MPLIVPAPVQEPDRDKVIKEGKPRRTKKIKRAAPEPNSAISQPTSLLTEEQANSLAERKQQHADLVARIEPIKQMLSSALESVKGAKMAPFTLDISDNPVLMKIAKKVFKRRKTSIDLAEYLQLVEMLKAKQLSEIETYKGNTI
jgi:hypothetical protein